MGPTLASVFEFIAEIQDGPQANLCWLPDVLSSAQNVLLVIIKNDITFGPT
jgi:hypothetical protein